MHIFLKHRNVIDNDGNWVEMIDSVWVKAQIISLMGPDECLVEHAAWNCMKKSRVIRSIHYCDMRGAEVTSYRVLF